PASVQDDTPFDFHVVLENVERGFLRIGLRGEAKLQLPVVRNSASEFFPLWLAGCPEVKAPRVQDTQRAGCLSVAWRGKCHREHEHARKANHFPKLSRNVFHDDSRLLFSEAISRCSTSLFDFGRRFNAALGLCLLSTDRILFQQMAHLL